MPGSLDSIWALVVRLLYLVRMKVRQPFLWEVVWMVFLVWISLCLDQMRSQYGWMKKRASMSGPDRWWKEYLHLRLQPEGAVLVVLALPVKVGAYKWDGRKGN